MTLSKTLILLVALAAGASAFVPVPQSKLPVMGLKPVERLPNARIEQSSTALSATAVPAGGAAEEKKGPGKLQIGAYFALWYLFNIGYNIFNKQALNMLDLPWTMASIQLFVGIPYALILWMTKLRKAPKLSTENVKNLLPSAACHLGTHVGAVLSLGAGAVSFTHIVKASEPVVSALLSAIFLKQFLPVPVYLSLLPVIGGVGLASLKELSFSWLAFGTAMLSNVASASRAILSKTVLSGKPLGENLTAPNLYAVLTILSFCMLLPLGLAIEGPGKIMGAWDAAIAAGHSGTDMIIKAVLSGAFYYLYNEVAFLALDNVAPVTHAVGNTIKRVVIILASVVVFRNPLSPLGAAGSAIAILGTLLYSLAKNKYATPAPKK